MKLGKLPPSDRKAVRFGDFVKVAPDHPLTDVAPNLFYPMDHNDVSGVCVVAGWDHARQVIRFLLSSVVENLTDEQIWAYYQTQNPTFDPNGTASTNGPGSSADNGMNIQNFLSYLVDQKQILAFARVDYTNQEELRAAAYIGLGLLIGAVVDQAQIDQFLADAPWDNVPGSPQLGGHAVAGVGYLSAGLTAVSWAKLINLSPKFITSQLDEAWFILLPEHIAQPQFRNHFDIQGFADAVYNITDGKVIVPVMPPAPGNYQFTRGLAQGMRNSEVTELQKRLLTEHATDGGICYRYTEKGIPVFTDYFGSNTKAAVVRYQLAHGLQGVGEVGPKTRAVLNGKNV